MKENEGKRDLIILNVHLIQAEVLYSNSGMILQLWVKKNLFLLLWNFCHVFDYQIIVSIYVSIYEWTESTGATVVNSLSHVHQEIKEKSLFFFISSFFFIFILCLVLTAFSSTVIKNTLHCRYKQAKRVKRDHCSYLEIRTQNSFNTF